MEVTEIQLDNLKEVIQTELLKRGFHTPITKFEVVERRGSKKLGLLTAPFQTTPVIFKELKIENFSSYITEKSLVREDGKEVFFLEAGLSVYVNWEHFDSGTNGCRLFSISCRFFEGREEPAKIEIK